MLAALVAGFLIFSGGNGFAAKLFDKHTQALVRQLVAEPARADEAVASLKQGQHELEGLGKDFEKVFKSFGDADADQSAGLDELTPIMERAFELRHLEQQEILDRVFELRSTLTADEWLGLLDGMKAAAAGQPEGSGATSS